MTKDIISLLVIGSLVLMIAHWVISPIANVSGLTTLLIIIMELGIVLIFVVSIEIAARYLASKELPVASQTGFDPGFNRYLQAYRNALPVGTNQQTVHQTLAGYHRRFEERISGRLIEYFVYHYGFLGRPVIEVEYDIADNLILIQEGYLD